MGNSLLELLMNQQILDAGLPTPEREYRFHPKRKWPFDFAWPDLWLALEVEGGEWMQGRHNRAPGFMGDCEKYAEATLLGWMVLRVPGTWVKNGKAIQYLKRAVRFRAKQLESEDKRT